MVPFVYFWVRLKGVGVQKSNIFVEVICACVPHLLLRGRGCGVGGRVVALARRVRGPEREVVTQQLHDQGRVLVAVLVQGVQLGDGVVKCLKKQKQKANERNVK